MRLIRSLLVRRLLTGGPENAADTSYSPLPNQQAKPEPASRAGARKAEQRLAPNAHVGSTLRRNSTVTERLRSRLETSAPRRKIVGSRSPRQYGIIVQR
jgi:hypothetical protein